MSILNNLSNVSEISSEENCSSPSMETLCLLGATLPPPLSHPRKGYPGSPASVPMVPRTPVFSCGSHLEQHLSDLTGSH